MRTHITYERNLFAPLTRDELGPKVLIR
jgi:hypothetical protein